jgi:microcystin-dependent protein
MSQPYVGEIRMFGGNFAPAGWMFTEGQLLPISEYETLFNLIGTTYGGDGQSTFALPDLRGRLPMHMGNGFTLAQTGGAETVTLTVPTIPSHSHPYLGTTNTGSSNTPNNNVIGGQTVEGNAMFAPAAGTIAMNTNAIGSTGGSQPYLCISFIISLFGVFPSPT